MLKFRQNEDGSWQGYYENEKKPKKTNTKTEETETPVLSESSAKSLDNMDASELKAYAAENGITIPVQVSKRETILKKIREAQ